MIKYRIILNKYRIILNKYGIILNKYIIISMRRLAEWVTFVHTAVMATLVMRRVRNPAYTAASSLVKERHINGQQEAPLTLCMWRYINEVHLKKENLYKTICVSLKMILMILILIFFINCLDVIF